MYLQLLKKYSQFLFTHFFDCLSLVVKENKLLINLVISILFRKNFSSILLLLSSKLRLFAKQYNMLVCCFLKDLLTFEWINIIRLFKFEWINIIWLFSERPFFPYNVLFYFSTFAYISMFIFLIQYLLFLFIHLKFNQDRNLEFLTRELKSRYRGGFRDFEKGGRAMSATMIARWRKF